MPTNKYTALSLALSTVDDHTAAALHDHLNRMQAERFPADPLPAFEPRLERWRATSHASSSRTWIVWHPTRQAIIASAGAGASTTEEQAQVVIFDVTVAPAYRQQGIGRQLLSRIADFAHQQSRQVLLTQTQRHIAAGAIWMRQIGAEPSVESQSLQLTLADVDKDVLRRWIERGDTHAFELGFWSDSYPENDLAAIARLHEVHNDAPRKSDAIAETHMTPARLRDGEQELFTQGNIRWTTYVRERATGTLVGFTEVTWNPADPEQVEQGVTGVLPAYRKRGLGHWLKAAMLHKLIDEQPQFGMRVIRTGNATSNTAMLNLNHDLGFRTISADTWWQMNLAQVQKYVARPNIAASVYEQH